LLILRIYFELLSSTGFPLQKLAGTEPVTFIRGPEIVMVMAESRYDIPDPIITDTDRINKK
jgi:hypothetical protein